MSRRPASADFGYSAAILQLAVEHRLGDGQEVDDGVVVDVAAVGHAGRRRHEQRFFGLGGLDIAEGRMRYRLGIVQHGHVRAVELLGDDRLPFAEAHQNVLLHRETGFQKIRHRRRFDAQHGLGHRGNQFRHRRDRWRVLAQEQGTIDGEVDVVDHVDQVDARNVRTGEDSAVGHQRFFWL